jgi:hypothetical protein
LTKDWTKKLLVIKTKDILQRNTGSNNSITLLTNIYTNVSPAREKEESLRGRVTNNYEQKKIVTQQQDDIHPQFIIYKITTSKDITSEIQLIQNQYPIAKIKIN